MRYWKSLSLNILLSILISLVIIYLSTINNLWGYFWGSLSIPAQIPFSDLKAHIQFYNCHTSGINIYLEGCDLIPDGNAKISTHPQIWLNIISFFNLTNTNIYNFFIFTNCYSNPRDIDPNPSRPCADAHPHPHPHRTNTAHRILVFVVSIFSARPVRHFQRAPGV